ncbi:UDP-N-acetylmuramate dehydrogenase [Microgenomates group bacterium]|nr:UDP-N-acetylmuramate dehydrogenase [Microgenomates group bacterium]
MHQSLRTAFPDIPWQEHFPLGALSTIRLGGHVALYAPIDDEDVLCRVVQFCFSHNLPYRVVGGLSNLIVPDKTYSGVVLHNKTARHQLINAQKGLISFSSGYSLAALVNRCFRYHLGEGLESFMSLPGTLGGAIFNNAHFGSSLIGDFIHSVRVYQPADSQTVDLTPSSLNFAYEHSIFQEHPDWVILGATFQLSPVDPALAKKKAQEVLAWRQEKQPLNFPSAGSFFQNVPNNDILRARFPQFADQKYVSTAFLIDQAGLRGHRLGNIQISPQHAGFIVNLGSGTYADLMSLVHLVKNTLTREFSVSPPEEVFYLI